MTSRRANLKAESHVTWFHLCSISLDHFVATDGGTGYGILLLVKRFKIRLILPEGIYSDEDLVKSADDMSERNTLIVN